MDGLRFSDPYREVVRTENRLPHWQQEGAVDFVTFRLADSLPRSLTDRWNVKRAAWLKHHPEPWTGELEREYRKRFLEPWENGLDRGLGECLLRRPVGARCVGAALGYFEGGKVSQLSGIVVPNHVHALFVLKAEEDLGKLLQSWKRFSARQINEAPGREGTVWQEDYFDRVVRDAAHLVNGVRSIRRNPQRAKFASRASLHFGSEPAKEVP